MTLGTVATALRDYVEELSQQIREVVVSDRVFGGFLLAEEETCNFGLRGLPTKVSQVHQLLGNFQAPFGR